MTAYGAKENWDCEDDDEQEAGEPEDAARNAEVNSEITRVAGSINDGTAFDDLTLTLERADTLIRTITDAVMRARIGTLLASQVWFASRSRWRTTSAPLTASAGNDGKASRWMAIGRKEPELLDIIQHFAADYRALYCINRGAYSPGLRVGAFL